MPRKKVSEMSIDEVNEEIDRLSARKELLKPTIDRLAKLYGRQKELLQQELARLKAEYDSLKKPKFQKPISEMTSEEVDDELAQLSRYFCESASG